MPTLRWIPAYSVNNVELDSHHKRMFHIVNAAYENTMFSSEDKFIFPIIDELSVITRNHISEEELYMRKLKFPDIVDHILTHREFMLKIDSLRMNSHQGNNNHEDTKELIILLGEWLLHHIINEDWKYSELSAGIREGTKISLISS